MNILFADALSDVAVQALRAAGHGVVVDASLKDDALVAALASHRPDALVVRSTKVTAAHLQASSELSIVVRAGAGVNTIDLDAAGRRGVYVANCPGKNAVAVAELTFALLLALDRHVADCVIDAREGRWNKGAWSKALGLKGRTLGIVGMGQIGEEVARRARAFDMPVVAWSRSLTPARAEALGVRALGSATEVAAEADVVSLHLALTPDTRGLVDAAFLAAMKPGSVLLNTSRAEVVDEAALLEALDARNLSAGLDVLAGEPAGKTGLLDDPLARHSRVVLTHHIGASTQEAQDAVAHEVARILLTFDRTGRAPNVVNLLDETSASHVLIVRHLDEVGVLAGVLDALRSHGINVQEMENTIFAGGEAAVARIQVDGDPSAGVDELNALEHVLHVACVRLTARRA